jgi:hypothetical protein
MTILNGLLGSSADDYDEARLEIQDYGEDSLNANATPMNWRMAV